MHLKLKNQILTIAQPILVGLSQLTDEVEIEQYKKTHSEILTIAEQVQKILEDNLQMLENKITNGKQRILG